MSATQRKFRKSRLVSLSDHIAPPAWRFTAAAGIGVTYVHLHRLYCPCEAHPPEIYTLPDGDTTLGTAVPSSSGRLSRAQTAASFPFGMLGFFRVEQVDKGFPCSLPDSQQLPEGASTFLVLRRAAHANGGLTPMMDTTTSNSSGEGRPYDPSKCPIQWTRPSSSRTA